MTAQKRRRNRRGDDMKFAYSGPFAPLLDPRVGRTLPLTKERYTPDSPESYAIWTRLEGTVRDVLLPFMAVAESPRPKRRGRKGGGRRVAA